MPPNTSTTETKTRTPIKYMTHAAHDWARRLETALQVLDTYPKQRKTLADDMDGLVKRMQGAYEIDWIGTVSAIWTLPGR